MGGKGNGGDICEKRIINIRDNLKEWVESNQGEKLNFPKTITAAIYKTKMLEAIESTTISCVVDILSIDDTEKTCINISNEVTKTSLMKCNIKRFKDEMSESEQYKLIHHEYAGIAGIETNNGRPESNYVLSDQIEDLLSYKVVKYLPINTSDEIIETKNELVLEIPQDVFSGINYFRKKFPCKTWEECQIPSINNLEDIIANFKSTSVERISLIKKEMLRKLKLSSDAKAIANNSNIVSFKEYYLRLAVLLDEEARLMYRDKLSKNVIISGNESPLLTILDGFIRFQMIHSQNEFKLLKEYKKVWNELYDFAYTLKKIPYITSLQKYDRLPMDYLSFYHLMDVNENCSKTPLEEKPYFSKIYSIEKGDYMDNRIPQGIRVIADFKLLENMFAIDTKKQMKLNCIKVGRYSKRFPNFDKETNTLNVFYS